MIHPLDYCRHCPLTGAMSFLMRSISGKCIAKIKDVHCGVESEESRGQSSGLMNNKYKGKGQTLGDAGK